MSFKEYLSLKKDLLYGYIWWIKRSLVNCSPHGWVGGKKRFPLNIGSAHQWRCVWSQRFSGEEHVCTLLLLLGSHIRRHILCPIKKALFPLRSICKINWKQEQIALSYLSFNGEKWGGHDIWEWFSFTLFHNNSASPTFPRVLEEYLSFVLLYTANLKKWTQKRWLAILPLDRNFKTWKERKP